MSIFSSVKDHGFRVTCAYALHNVLQKLGWGDVHYYGFFSQPLGDAALPRAYHAQIIEAPGPVSHLIGLPEGVARERCEAGSICVGTYYEDQLIGALWFSSLPFKEDEVDALYDIADGDKPKYCWDFGVYIDPEWRASRAFAAVWAAGAHAMRDMGYVKSLSRISLYNEASAAAHRRLGAQEFGRAWFIHVGNVQISISNLSPWLHISRKNGPAPVFEMKIKSGQ